MNNENVRSAPIAWVDALPEQTTSSLWPVVYQSMVYCHCAFRVGFFSRSTYELIRMFHFAFYGGNAFSVVRGTLCNGKYVIFRLDDSDLISVIRCIANLSFYHIVLALNSLFMGLMGL
jgi:hypothetical protein